MELSEEEIFTKQTEVIHPARKFQFDELYKGLISHVEKSNISLVKNGNLELFSYTKKAVYNKKWNIFTLMARGLILDPKNKKVVATPFPKFFNYGEEVLNYDKIKGEIYSTNKYDGSLGICYFYGGCWHISTKGSFHSDQAKWGKQWFDLNINHCLLDKECTYLFEIIYSDNKIVVTYNYEKLILLSAYDKTGQEFSRTRIETLGDKIGLQIAKTQNVESLSSLIKESVNLSHQFEGWVIRFENGHRLKIKGKEYLRIHRLISNITPLFVWNMLLEGSDLENIRQELPQEHLNIFNDYVSHFKKRFKGLLSYLASMVNRHKNLSNKEIGLAFKNVSWKDKKPILPQERRFLFLASRDKFLVKVHTVGSKERKHVFNTFRPSNNTLN